MLGIHLRRMATDAVAGHLVDVAGKRPDQSAASATLLRLRRAQPSRGQCASRAVGGVVADEDRLVQREVADQRGQHLGRRFTRLNIVVKRILIELEKRVRMRAQLFDILLGPLRDGRRVHRVDRGIASESLYSCRHGAMRSLGPSGQPKGVGRLLTRPNMVVPESAAPEVLPTTRFCCDTYRRARDKFFFEESTCAGKCCAKTPCLPDREWNYAIPEIGWHWKCQPPFPPDV